MWMLKNKSTGEIVDPRSAEFALSPADVVEGATDWDEVFATHSEVDFVDGYEAVQAFKFATDSESGTIEAATFEAACESLKMSVPDEAVENGGWGWVEDIDGDRFEIGAPQ